MRTINFHTAENKDKFFTKCNDIFKVLKQHYQFYYNNLCHEIKDLDSLLKKKKDTFTHRICVYYIENECYFVIYAKDFINIEILNNCKGNRIAYKLRKELEQINNNYDKYVASEVFYYDDNENVAYTDNGPIPYNKLILRK